MCKEHDDEWEGQGWCKETSTERFKNNTVQAVGTLSSTEQALKLDQISFTYGFGICYLANGNQPSLLSSTSLYHCLTFPLKLRSISVIQRMLAIFGRYHRI